MSRIISLKAAEDADGEYRLKGLSAPVLKGTPLKIFLALAESPLFAPIRAQLQRQNGMPQALEEVYVPEAPLYRADLLGWPKDTTPGAEEITTADGDACDVVDRAVSVLGKDNPHLPHPTILDYSIAYKTGKISPSQVAKKILDAIQESEAKSPPMKFLIEYHPDEIMRAAVASDMRYSNGSTLSVLDGVPFCIKDCIDVAGYQTTCGSSFMGSWRPVSETIAGVQALLDAGAILIGKSNMHEFGVGTTGLNTVHGTPRNPHNFDCFPGGSSSGSAAAVAAGLCPFAVGSDGGGSIRIPASLCGVVGMKVTETRICTEPHPPIDQTVQALGPISISIKDAALIYAVMSNRGHAKVHEAQPPALTLPDLADIAEKKSPLQGKKAGIFWPWFNDCDPQVHAKCKLAVDLLESKGLEIISIPVPELELLRAAHMCTVVSEMSNNMNAMLLDGATRRQLNAETRLTLAIAAGFSSAQYVQAQKLRKRFDGHFRRIFSSVDYVITPTTPITAPPIKPGVLAAGQSDLETTTTLMRFIQLPNMLGLPALTVPVGVVPPSSGEGGPDMPVGLQFMAGPWHEGSVLLAGAVLEAGLGGQGCKKAAVSWDMF